MGDLVLCDAELVYTGRTSMAIHVKARRESLKTGKLTRYAMEGHWLMVALDENKQPAPVPPLKIETDEQRRKLQEYEKRFRKLKA